MPAVFWKAGLGRLVVLKPSLRAVVREFQKRYRQFEFTLLQQAVDDVRDSLGESAKSPRLAEIFALGSTGEVLSAALRMDFAGFLSGRESGGGLSGFRQTFRAGHDE